MIACRLHPLRVLTVLIATCGAGALPSAALAQRAATTAGRPAAPAPAGKDGAARSDEGDRALAAERQRLRGELERVQGDIDRLKLSDRGLRDDYRLRARMADAEALARRLTEIDARLGAAAPAAAARPRLGAEPGASPSDGPAELEAKADILTDQSRRVQQQIESLRARGEQLRGREELRRRNGQLDRDPFAPLEGSKRRAIAGTAAAPPRTNVPTSATADRGVAGPSATPPPPLFGAGAGPATPSVYLHDLLDANTLAEIRKLEATGSATSNLEAIDRAIQALAAKARHLDAQSRALRDQARAAGR